MSNRAVLIFLFSLCMAGCGYKTDLTLPDEDAQTLVHMQSPVSETFPLL